MKNFLLVLCLTLFSAFSYGKACEVKPGPKGGLALYKNNKLISKPQITIPELVYEDYEELVKTGICPYFEPKPCSILPFGEEGLFVVRAGVRVSDAWDSLPEFAYRSLERLVDIGYCSELQPRVCKIVITKNRKYIIQSEGKRVSQLWDNKVYAKASLERAQDFNYCR